LIGAYISRSLPRLFGMVNFVYFRAGGNL